MVEGGPSPSAPVLSCPPCNRRALVRLIEGIDACLEESGIHQRETPVELNLATMKVLFVQLCALLCLFSGNVTGFAPSSRRAPSQRVISTPTSFGTTEHQCRPAATSLFGKKAARAAGNERKNKTVRVKKPKDDVIEVEGTVIESMPNAMFRCTIDGAPDTQDPVLATISGKIRKNFVKILVGDSVSRDDHVVKCLLPSTFL